MSRALFRYYDYHLFASFVTLMTEADVTVGCPTLRAVLCVGELAEVSGAGWLAHAGLHGAVGGAWK